MYLHFLGGATTVTGSQFLLDTGRARVLIDCGMFQGSPNEAVRNRVPFAFEPSELDAVVLTHAHLDHCGLLPVLVREGFSGPIHCTAGTAELARLVLLDSGKLHEQFAKREARWEKRHPDRVEADDRAETDAYQAAVTLASEGNAVASEATLMAVDAAGAAEPASDPEVAIRMQPASVEIDLDAPLYTQDDAEAVLPQFRPSDYGTEVEVAPGVHATFLDAGHILGSAIIRLRVQQDGERPERVIVVSGDLGRPGTPIIRDPTVLDAADYVLVESTYGGREHEPSDEAVRILAETVRLVDEANGVLLIPSFAIGRTQEIVWQLDRLIEQGTIPLLPLYLDSPMASRASDIYRKYVDYFDEETGTLLRSGDTPLDYPNQIITNDVEDFEGDRASAAAVPDRGLERDADWRQGGRPPPQPHRRSERDAAVRRLPGRGHARRAPAGRGDFRSHRRAAARSALPGALDWRLLGTRRRAGTPCVAWQLRPWQAHRRGGVSAAGVPRPWRSGGPVRARAEGPRARLRGPRAALARARRTPVIVSLAAPDPGVTRRPATGLISTTHRIRTSTRDRAPTSHRGPVTARVARGATGQAARWDTEGNRNGGPDNSGSADGLG